jgi:hypothetical protein
MRIFRPEIAWGILSSCLGCGTTVPASTTRTLSVDPSTLSGLPVCFVLPGPNLGLTERGDAEHVLAICENAVRAQKIGVVPYGSSSCLVARLKWTSGRTGEFDTDCTGVVMPALTATCKSSEVRYKSLKVTVSREPDGPPVAETRATIRSSQPGFTDQSYFALCGSAFHQYPRAIRNAQFEARVE